MYNVFDKVYIDTHTHTTCYSQLNGEMRALEDIALPPLQEKKKDDLMVSVGWVQSSSSFQLTHCNNVPVYHHHKSQTWNDLCNSINFVTLLGEMTNFSVYVS